MEEYFPSAGRIKVVDDDDRDCCASTMDLETDLDMERFLTQAPPFSDSAVLVVSVYLASRSQLSTSC